MKNLKIPNCGEVLKQRRKELGLKQKEVAERARIPLRQYQKYEGELNMMTASFVFACRVIEALEMDIADFFHENAGEED